VVGASCFNNFSGAAYIYQRSGTKWTLKASFTDPEGNANDSYGGSSAVAGGTVLIGSSAFAYIYTDGTQGWQQTGLLVNPGDVADGFGQPVALSGTTAVVSAPIMASGAGAVYVFTENGTTWTESQELTAPANAQGSRFGGAVALSGQRLLIGMPTFGTVNCGTAFEYTSSGGTWGLKGQVTDPGCGSGDQFGFSVATAGGFGIYGAPGTSNFAGANYEMPLP
jgi:hypothetical protein